MCRVCAMIMHIKGIASAAYSGMDHTHRLTTAAFGYFAPLYGDLRPAVHNNCSAVHFNVDSRHARTTMPTGTLLTKPSRSIGIINSQTTCYSYRICAATCVTSARRSPPNVAAFGHCVRTPPVMSVIRCD